MNEAVIPFKHSETASTTIGEKLRYARESKKLSQQEISKALCLPVHVIDALEQDTYEKLPAPVFVKGYLRNYAHLLSIPFCAEEVKTNTSITLKPLKPQSALSSFTSLSWLRMSEHLLLKLWNFAVFIIILCLLFLWWYDRHSAAEKELSLANLSVEKIPFPRAHLEPLPPDLTPWLDIENGEHT